MSDEHKSVDSTEYPDEDTKAIIEEMEKENPKSEPEPKPEQIEDETSSDEEDETPPKPADEPEVNPDKDEDDDDDEGEDDDEVENDDEYKDETVPLKKHLKLKQKLKEAKKALAEVKTVNDDPDLYDREREKKLNDIADKWGTDPGFIKELASALDISPKIKEVLKERIKENEIKHQDEEYDNEFNKKVLPLIKAEYGEDVSPDVIKSIKSVHKKLAFSKELLHTPADIIYNGVKDFREFGDKITAEDSGGKRTKGGYTVKDFKNMSPEEAIKTLSDEDFEKWSDYKEQEEKINRQNNN